MTRDDGRLGPAALHVDEAAALPYTLLELSGAVGAAIASYEAEARRVSRSRMRSDAKAYHHSVAADIACKLRVLEGILDAQPSVRLALASPNDRAVLSAHAEAESVREPAGGWGPLAKTLLAMAEQLDAPIKRLDDLAQESREGPRGSAWQAYAAVSNVADALREVAAHHPALSEPRDAQRAKPDCEPPPPAGGDLREALEALEQLHEAVFHYASERVVIGTTRREAAWADLSAAYRKAERFIPEVRAALSALPAPVVGADKLTALFAAAMMEGHRSDPDQIAAREPVARTYAKRALAALSPAPMGGKGSVGSASLSPSRGDPTEPATPSDGGAS